MKIIRHVWAEQVIMEELDWNRGLSMDLCEPFYVTFSHSESVKKKYSRLKVNKKILK